MSLPLPLPRFLPAHVSHRNCNGLLLQSATTFLLQSVTVLLQSATEHALT